MTVDTAGQVIEREEEVALDTIPAAAKAASRRRPLAADRKGRVGDQGGATNYEASLKKGGKKSEIVVGSDGAIKKH